MADTPKTVSTPNKVAIDQFLAQAANLPTTGPTGQGRGRLLVGIDATASRQPTWDQACQVQGDMFGAARGLGGLAIQLVFFRSHAEMKRTPWLHDAEALRQRMQGVRCLGGFTQIGRLLRYAHDEHQRNPMAAMVFIGDAVEEDMDALCHQAGQSGLSGLPLFLFQEGGNPQAAACFRQMARLSGGAYAPFDINSPDRLRALLAGVAAFAAGGVAALQTQRSAVAGLLAGQLAGKP